jgi:hypothetical protein
MAVRNPRGYGPQRYVNDNATSTVMEDGVEISDVINTFNFAGDGVSTSVVDDVVTVTVPGTFTVQEEGVTTSTAVRTLNFVGAGTASGGAATATITIPAATLTTQEEGSTLSSTVTTINFVGQDLVASGAGATTTVTKGGLATTVTSATPVVLTAASARIQVFTGSTAQTVTLPVVATAPASNGYNWEFHNNSTATMTIQTSGRCDDCRHCWWHRYSELGFCVRNFGQSRVGQRCVASLPHRGRHKGCLVWHKHKSKCV